MPIYTRTGDRGLTALFGAKRVSKSDTRIEAYGSVDELTSFIGLLIARASQKNEKELLTRIQQSLYQIMGHLATARVNLKTGSELLDELDKEVALFERQIDTITKKLPPLTRFVLPQGNEMVALYHIARTVCRRAERRVVALGTKAELDVVQYLNRLSDLFFTFARYHSRGKEITT